MKKMKMITFENVCEKLGFDLKKIEYQFRGLKKYRKYLSYKEGGKHGRTDKRRNAEIPYQRI